MRLGFISHRLTGTVGCGAACPVVWELGPAPATRWLHYLIALVLSDEAGGGVGGDEF